MKIAIINGTNRKENRTIETANSAVDLVEKLGHQASLITLEGFNKLFRGSHITQENANSNQLKNIKTMIWADVLLFVVPTYHTGIPSPLKNFFDILKNNRVYDNKIIGIISSNSHGSDFGARQAAQIINGILAYNKLVSFIVPIIPIINFDNIDQERIEKFIIYCTKFMFSGRGCAQGDHIYKNDSYLSA